MMMSCDDASAIHGVDARIEVFTAKARRRVSSDEDKVRIVAESYGDDRRSRAQDDRYHRG